MKLLLLPLILFSTWAADSEMASRVKLARENVCAIAAPPTEAGATCVDCAVKIDTGLEDVKSQVQSLLDVVAQQQDRDYFEATEKLADELHCNYCKYDPAGYALHELKDNISNAQSYINSSSINDAQKLIEIAEVGFADPRNLTTEQRETLKTIAHQMYQEGEQVIALYKMQPHAESSEDLLRYEKKLKMGDQLKAWFEKGSLSPSASVFQDLIRMQREEIRKVDEHKENYRKQLEDLKKGISEKEEKAKAEAEKWSRVPGSDYTYMMRQRIRHEIPLQTIRHNEGYKACGMSVAEISALFLYSANGYMRINQVLRNGSEEERKKYAPIINTLKSALKKLKPYSGLVRRGADLPTAVLEEHQPGAVVNYKAFTSTSVGSGFGSTHSFVIQSKNGRFVGAHSRSSGEEEVLFLPDTRFKILDRTTLPSGKIEFVLEEVVE